MSANAVICRGAKETLVAYFKVLPCLYLEVDDKERREPKEQGPDCWLRFRPGTSWIRSKDIIRPGGMVGYDKPITCSTVAAS
jgi:hypothetical protein